MKSDRKPPLAKSPLRIRPRRVLRPNNSTLIQTTPGYLTKNQTPNYANCVKEPEVKPVYNTISRELNTLAKMVNNELGAINSNNAAIGDQLGFNPAGSFFERGRFYEEYSARRNEKLRRKQQVGTPVIEPKSAYNLGVKIESTKRKDASKKKFESAKKSMAVTYMDRSEHPRYALRSRKPPLPVPMAVEKSGETKTGRGRRK